MPAKIDLSTRGLWLDAEEAQFVELPIHARYDLELPTIPIMAVEEVIAEKLARYRRVSLARDLYDLAWCAERPFDRELVRELWYLKCYFDIVDDKLGERPVNPDAILADRLESSFRMEQIGYLTKPVDFPAWLRTVRSRFAFLNEPTEAEQLWANANPRDRYQALQATQDLNRG